MKITMPDHAYLPGKTKRHEEGAFDTIRNSVEQGMDEAALASTAAFQHGLAYLDAGFFWEAHEVLEPVWMALPDSAERQFVQGLIQLANALLKERMERPNAARRLADISRTLLEQSNDSIMGVEVAKYLGHVASLDARLPN